LDGARSEHFHGNIGNGDGQMPETGPTGCSLIYKHHIKNTSSVRFSRGRTERRGSVWMSKSGAGINRRRLLQPSIRTLWIDQTGLATTMERRASPLPTANPKFHKGAASSHYACRKKKWMSM
jgi:hypothetical protein